MSTKSYILATNQCRNLRAFYNARNQLPGNWAVAVNTQDLVNQIELLKPRYVFFPHWSEIVSQQVLEATECVCFHMTDVPYGRGGSPLQNLIVRGHKETKLTALRMTQTLDAGPFYLKHSLSLSGSAEEILNRAADISIQMMQRILSEEITPKQQVGEVTNFKRRTPVQSALPANMNLEATYDYIRMLDADGYPNAFSTHGDLKVEYRRATFNGNVLTTEVKITSQVKDD